MLTRQQEIDLCIQAQKGCAKSLERVVQCNMGLVYNRVNRHPDKSIHQDLIQEGSIGLMRACLKFKGDQGTRFSTYAIFWVKTHLDRYTHRLIRVPYHRLAQLNSFKQAQRLHNNGMSLDEALYNLPINAKDYAVLEALPQGIDSLEKPLLDGEMTLSDVLLDPDAVDPFDLLDSNTATQSVMTHLCGLTKLQQELVRQFFGIGCEPMSTHTLSKQYNMSRTTVGKKVNEAVALIRHRIKNYPINKI